MLRAEYIAVKQEKEKEDILIPVASKTNPSVLPSQGDMVNIQGERFIVSGVEWFITRELVNIYMVYKG